VKCEKIHLYAWNVSAKTLSVNARVFCFCLRLIGGPLNIWECLYVSNLFLHKLGISSYTKSKRNSSNGGHIGLIQLVILFFLKSVLSALPIFQFSSILSPVGIKNALVKGLRKFIWQGGNTNHKHFHLMNWNIMHTPKAHGGLGIEDLMLMNIALGAKLLWRLITGIN
jgi:hypothetical protein